MITICRLGTCVLIFCSIWTSSIMLLLEENNENLGLQKPRNGGQCLTYAMCGDLYCANNNFPLLLTNQTAVNILRHYCPFMVPDDQPSTCCNADQLFAFNETLQGVEQLFSNCPTCFSNFVSMFCLLACDSYQNNVANGKAHIDSKTKLKVVTSVDYYISRDYAMNMFKSCQDVHVYNSDTLTVFDLICTKTNCTLEELLHSFSTVNANKVVPLSIDFKITDAKYIVVGNKTFVPVNPKTMPCTGRCSHKNCRTTPSSPTPEPKPCPHGSCFSGEVRSLFREEQIVITRPNNRSKVVHHAPPPAPVFDITNFTSLFDNEFLHMVLDLQNAIFNISSDFHGKKIYMRDICYKPAGFDDNKFGPSNANCDVRSILEYWQSNSTNLSKMKMDEWGFYVEADFLDHFNLCSKHPSSYDYNLELSCRSQSGQLISPYKVLVGFGDQHYNEATGILITFLVNNYQDVRMNGMARAWEEEMKLFVQNFSSPNMTISYAIQV